jgi:hypothetical protein
MCLCIHDQLERLGVCMSNCGRLKKHVALNENRCLSSSTACFEIQTDRCMVLCIVPAMRQLLATSARATRTQTSRGFPWSAITRMRMTTRRERLLQPSPAYRTLTRSSKSPCTQRLSCPELLVSGTTRSIHELSTLVFPCLARRFHFFPLYVCAYVCRSMQFKSAGAYHSYFPPRRVPKQYSHT